MVRNKLRIIVDTNWYISANINKKSRRIFYNLLNSDKLSVLFSEEILFEYRTVIARDKFKKIINPRQALRFMNMNLVIPKLEKVETKTEVQISRDPNDNYLLALAIDNKADYLVTGDIDLLILENINNTKIVRLNDLIKQL